MATVFVGLIYSTYFEDALCHIDLCFSKWSDAATRKQEYEEEVKKNFGMVLPRIKTGADEELDRYNYVAHELDKAKKFLQYEIQEHIVI